ncbi:hypothetical protein GQ44DRAFT_718522 [Phaeosphaeriaceae sp. PMI808]|nr:hypothetical protein GQ44DRAFT_718522 [Phaeosphaeriaceae sp. PMI808]
MCDTIFAFGEDGAYLLECPSRRVYNNLPGDITFLYRESIVASTYCLALGPNNGYVLSYKADNGKTRIASQNIPQPLKAWLYAKDASDKHLRDFKKLSVTLGSDGKAYYATDRTSFVWNDLPPALGAGIETLKNSNGQFEDAPRVVSLGFGGDYFVLTQKNGCQWSLTNYPEFASIIPLFKDNSAFHTIKNIALSPHAKTACAGNLNSGASFAEGMPPMSKDQMQAMEKAIQCDTDKAKQQEQQLQQQQDAARIANASREAHLLQMSTRLSEQQMRHSAESIDRMGRIGTGCRCYSSFCTCRGY